MAKKLFGTDGVRGTAGQYPLDPKTIHALGMALGSVARHLGPKPEIVIGMDTRESSPWMAGQVAGGLKEVGVGVRFAGVVTTPGVAFLTHTDSFVAGVMISASHNPYEDNGIKVFGHSGYKLPDEEEHAMEEETFRLLEAGVDAVPVEFSVDEGLDRRYVDKLLSTLTTRLDGLSLVLDCGNGAASQLAPELFRRAGAAVRVIHCAPDGRNINFNCGALDVEKALQAGGMRLERTAVGDKYVLEEMLRSGAALGGEQSGHVIFTEYSTTGDGMLTALKILETVARTGSTLDELTADLKTFP